jgi:pimeloyl-ACP methyl ester carboxylesterase
MRPWLAGVLMAVVVCAAAWPFVRRHLQAMAVVRLVSGEPLPWVVRKLVVEPIRSQEVRFSTEAGEVRARLYVPEGHPDALALVVVHGVQYLGIDEPRLVRFAAAIAGCGLRVLTPELPGIKDYHVDAGSVRGIGESVKWFARQTGGPVGVMGLSFSGGLTLVAATDPAYRKDFKFVFAVGSQYAMDHVVTYYVTGREMRPDGTTERSTPHEYGPLMLVYEYLEDFVPAWDVAAIRPVLREHLHEDKRAQELAEARLTVSQRAEAAQLMDAESPVMRARLAVVATKHLQKLAAVSPHGRLRTMTTPVYLLHGQADTIIPSEETLWIASELPRGTLKAVLISPVLSHLGLDEAKAGVWDEWRLVHFFALMMRAAERN